MKFVFTMAGVSVTSVIALLCMCSINPMADGNSSQTGNNGITVTASAGQISGKSRSFTNVSVYEKNYRPHGIPAGICDSTVANEFGEFSFLNLAQGYYNLLISDTVNFDAAFIQGIPLFTDSSFTDTNTLMTSAGFITGQIADDSGRELILSYVYINGSPFYTVTGNSGQFLLGPLPPGNYTFGFHANFIMGISGDVASPSTSVVIETGSATVYPNIITRWQH